MVGARPLSGLRLIDIHHHVVLPEYEAALVRAGAGDPSRPLSKNDSPAIEYEKMAELGIAAAIINPLSVAGVHHGNDADARYLTAAVNEAQARFVSLRPENFGFFAALPLPDLDGALGQMEHALDELHADGLILLSHQNGVYVGDPVYQPLYAEMDRRSAIAFIHPTVPPNIESLGLKLWPAYIEYAFETTRVAANLIYHGLMGRYPNIKWILAHAGGTLPYLSLRLRLMEELESAGRKPPFPFVGAGRPFNERVPEGVAPYLDKFYFDVALSGANAPMAALSEVAQPRRILYGSDWPFLPKGLIVEQLDNLVCMPHFAGDRFSALERDNAIRLFKRFGD